MRASARLLLALGAAAARAADPPDAPGDAVAAPADRAPMRSPAPATEAGARADAAPRMGGAESPGRTGPAANWLVDAMEKGPGPARAQGGIASVVRADLDLLGGAGAPDARGEGATRPAAGDARAGPGAPAGPVYNPLDAFMSGWISARDRELLLPARDGDLLSASRGAARAQALPGADLAPPEPAGDPRGPSNPYLADLGPVSLSPAKPLPAPPLAPLAPLDLPELSRGLSAPAAKPEAARSLAPEIATPADDFKQRRRF